MKIPVIPAIAVLMLTAAASQSADTAWTTLLDGKSLTGWNAIGNANWSAKNGVVEADAGSGFLLTTAAYKDFELKAEFWVDDAANSGVFLRCENRTEVTQANSYEVNVYDKRPDQKYATGSIVDVASPAQQMTAGGKWNTFEITAKGKHLTVILNGVKTVDVDDEKHAEGPIALQRTLGIVRFRKVEIRRL